MAITRAQQVRQMLEEGGRIGFRRGAKAPDFNPAQAAANVGKASTASPGRQDPSKFGFDAREAQKSKQYSGITPTDRDGRIIEPKEEYEGTTEMGDVGVVPVPDKERQKKLKKQIQDKKLNLAEKFRIFNLKKLYESKTDEEEGVFKPIAASVIDSLTPTKLNVYDEVDPAFDMSYYGMSGENIADVDRLAKAINKAEKTGIISQKDFEDAYFGPEGKPPQGSFGGPDRQLQETDPCKGPNPPAYCFIGDKADETMKAQRNLDGIAPRFAGSIFDFTGMADGGRIGADEGGIMQMASAPDPMDTRNDMMQNLAIDNFGKPLKDLTEDEIIQIEEMMMEMDQYGSKPTSRSNKMMADLDIKSMIDEAKEQLSESRFGKSYDELDPLEKELILEIIRGVGKDVFGEKQMPESDRATAQEGGIMDLETGRQMYFLGKLVKKATRAVKKIAKSPLGKAAILGGAMYFGGQAGGLGALLKKAAVGAPTNLVTGKRAFSGLFGTGGEFNLAAGLIGQNPLISGAIGLGGLTLFGNKQEEEDLDMGPELTMEQLLAIRNSPYRFTAPRFEGSRYKFDEGGDAKEPVAKKTMPLLDMGGKEMDLRDNGGFVPIGRMEKADDVPARLSKNEFVFTADAVRNAGDGDVDKGAEVMYNMMKNLESGGEVSEESQGLQGARDMFQTSKRLEEVL
jgi:hypothetical protein